MARRELTDEEIRDQTRAARRGSVEATRVEPRAVDACYDPRTRRVLVELASGCLFAFPVSEGAGLQGASAAQLAEVEVWQDGEGLHWDDLDADISVPGIMERLLKLPEWAPRLMGQTTSDAKAQAARENGRRGGRPAKAADAPSRRASGAVREKPRG
jgi:hypothetical protein